MADSLPSELSGLLDADARSREAAWATFVGVHSRLLLHTARSQLRHDHDAAMDAYTYVLEQLQTDDCHRLRAYVADPRSKFTTWLVVVARRLCLDFHRQRYGRLRDDDPASRSAHAARRRLTDLIAEEINPEAVAGSESANPESRVLVRERGALVTAALATLDTRDRLLLKLRFEDDLSAREIAEIMAFPTPFHVYRRLNAVLAELRRGLQGRGMQGVEA